MTSTEASGGGGRNPTYYRRAIRLPCSALIVVQVMRDGTLGPCHTAIAINVSRYGLCLQMDGFLPAQATVELTPRDINITVLATIRYAYECDDGWLLGVAFSDVDWTACCGWPSEPHASASSNPELILPTHKLPLSGGQRHIV